MSETETTAVLSANAAFYAAMRAGDLDLMDRLWSRRRPVSCGHPGRPMIFGRGAVMASWRIILRDHAPPPIRPIEPHAVVCGGTALLLCREILGGVEMMASNSFALEDGQWRMLAHQAAQIPTPARD